jgi:hypothetical protein
VVDKISLAIIFDGHLAAERTCLSWGSSKRVPDCGRIHLKEHSKLLRADGTMEDVACVFVKKTQLMHSEGDIGKFGVR